MSRKQTQTMNHKAVTMDFNWFMVITHIKIKRAAHSKSRIQWQIIVSIKARNYYYIGFCFSSPSDGLFVRCIIDVLFVNFTSRQEYQ